MINQIFIKNLAIVDTLYLDIASGMSALTGETGAGKSILLDAIGLALGDRANSSIVRHGTQKAEICIEFDIANLAHVKQWMQENELNDENSCIIRRVISSEGRSKSYINGCPVPLQTLKNIGEQLVDIHGQHEHQSLIKKTIQRDILDNFAAHNDDITRLKSIFKQWEEIKNKINEITESNKEAEAKKEFLLFQIEEIESLSLLENEYLQLNSEHKILANSGEIISACHKANNLLTEDEQQSIQSAINCTISTIEQVNNNNPKLSSIIEMLNSASIQIEESAIELNDFAASIDTDPERLTYIENRIALIMDISRKHHTSPEQLLNVLQGFQQQLNTIENSAELTKELIHSQEQLLNEYAQLAIKISGNRMLAADELSKRISLHMQELGMSGGIFEIAVTQDESVPPTQFGIDTIEYLVAANVGQPSQPLNKVASGGELSRISLALQVAVTKNTSIPTLIFDEVDAGIGGSIAEIVGQQLRTLGDECQVLCVTHLPQVASQAHNHFMVKKQSTKDSTNTTIESLDTEQRVTEIARMLGGVEITKNTINHAREMLGK